MALLSVEAIVHSKYPVFVRLSANVATLVLHIDSMLCLMGYERGVAGSCSQKPENIFWSIYAYFSFSTSADSGFYNIQ